MAIDPVFLARVQFALTISFHYIFPPLSIGLGVLMVIMEGKYMATRNRRYEVMAKFWTKLFGLIFAMGVASGIVMEFQFGTNWATYSRFVGDIFGSALAAEGIFAFFLESGFLAVVVFGWDRVSPRLHFFSTIMVAFGSMLSAVWIVVANSWQQTPAGYHIVGTGLDRRAELTDFWAVIFNPSTAERLTHVLIGAFILGGFFVMSVSAYYLLKRRHEDFARRSFSIALPFAAIFSIAALLSGHTQAVNVAETQPGKLAAFEGHFKSTEGGAPLYLVGIPSEEEERVRAGIAIPGMLSFLVHGDWNKPVTALDDPAIVPEQHTMAPEETLRDYWPPVNITFQLYHAMVGLGGLFIVLTLVALFFRWRGTLFEKRWLLWVFVFAVIGPMAANQAGWAAAEIGRQPWVVYGMLKTADATSKAVSGAEVLASIVMFGFIYLLLLLVWVFVTDNKIRVGPEEVEALPAAEEREGWLDAAARRADASSRNSMTDARGQTSEDDSSPEARGS
jgi:cytochrome d ubiquinol oxidase subunit I